MCYIRKLNQQVLLQTNVIRGLLQWDELRYGQFQYKQGCEYLQLYIPGNPAGIDELLAHKLFWNWWKNQWYQRDHVYLVNIALHISVLSTEDIRAIYCNYHNVHILSREIAPASVIMTVIKKAHQNLKMEVA